MRELDYKESWAQKNWCFWTVVLEKTLESSLDCKEIQPVHPKGNQSWLFIGTTVKFKLQYFGHLMWRADSFEKTLMLGKIEVSVISHQSVSSVSQSCPTLCDPMDCSRPGLPVHHQLPEFTQTHVHRVSDAIQPSHLLSFSSCLQSFPASGSFQMSQLFTSGGQSIGV